MLHTDLTPNRSRNQQPNRNQRAHARPAVASAPPIARPQPNRNQQAPVRDEPVYIPDDNEEDPLAIRNACTRVEAEVAGAMDLNNPFPYESLQTFDRFLEANLPRLPLSLQIAVWSDIHHTLEKLQESYGIEKVGSSINVFVYDIL